MLDGCSNTTLGIKHKNKNKHSLHTSKTELSFIC